MDLRQRFLHSLAPTTFSPLALEFVRAEGVYLYDPQGKALAQQLLEFPIPVPADIAKDVAR
jgi:hypothetical protein